jgi:polyphosphate kinase
MERNLDKRIEVGTPILEPRLQKEIQVIFDTQWSDTTKSRIITKKLANKYKELDDQEPVRSQMKLYEHYKQLLPTKK